jgi:signal transduction histidine kinase
MSLRTAPAELFQRLRHPKTTVRARLALLYGGLFFLSGIALLVVTYALVDTAFPPTGSGIQVSGAHAPTRGLIRAQERGNDLHTLLVGSSIALPIMTVVSVAIGWIVAGRVLRPLRTITNTTRQISEDNLHQRLALAGPQDELRYLADTIDGLLERLDAAFEAQRSFVANASHELRTPLTLSRVTLQVALSDPALTLPALRAACEEAIETGRQQEQLIESLLVLARSQRGLDDRQPVDLAVIVTEVAHTHEPAAAALQLRLDVSVSSAPMSGDPHLIERMVSNLVENALRYNRARGDVQIAVDIEADQARLKVTNTGPQISSEQISRLLKPFQRNTSDRIAGEQDGLGLGLSIVQAIVTAHGAELNVHPGEAGGLDVEVRFHRAPTLSRNGNPVQRSDAKTLNNSRSPAGLK